MVIKSGIFFLGQIKRNAHNASIRMKRLFSLSSTKSSSSRSLSDRKSGTLSTQRKAGLAMKPNLVSPQQSILSPKMTGDQRGSGDTFCQQGDEDKRNNDKNIVYRLPSIEDEGNVEDKLDFPQLSGKDVQERERDVVSPQSRVEVEHGTDEKGLFTHQQSSEEQKTVEQYEQNNEETSIDPQQSTAVEQNEEQPVQNSDVTSVAPEQSIADDAKQANTGKDLNFSQQISASQRENNEIQGSNAEIFLSPQEEQQDEPDGEDISFSHQNDSDQSEKINEESLISPQLKNLCANQQGDHNNIINTRL